MFTIKLYQNIITILFGADMAQKYAFVVRVGLVGWLVGYPVKIKQNRYSTRACFRFGLELDNNYRKSESTININRLLGFGR